MESGTNVTIIVATHKRYRMPADQMYLPLHVGAEGKTDADGNELDLGYAKDNTGNDNISCLNANFCELTGLYWAWKNIESDYIGLAHYRRHFGIKRSKDSWECVLTYKDIAPYLNRIKVFVPNKRRYYIETLYSHYGHAHYASHLDAVKEIIAEKYPEYLKSYNKVMNWRWGYMFNMAIMEKGLLNEYCSWVFDILFEAQNRIQATDLSAFQARFYGRISEIIFNVWLDYQLSAGKLSRNEIKEFHYIHMEKINWRKKGIAFLKAKFMNKKYEGSF